MSATISKVTIDGVQEIKNSLAVPKLSKEVVAGVRSVANDLHTELVQAVHKRYALGRSLNSVLIGNGAGIRIAGNVITATLAYEYQYVDLSKFPYSPLSIPNRYATHRVNVLRGQTQIVHGKSGNGGFVPRKSPRHPTLPNQAWRARDGGTRMFERVGRARLPLRVLYGPSLSQMANTVVTKHPTPGIINIEENFDKLVAAKVNI